MNLDLFITVGGVRPRAMMSAAFQGNTAAPGVASNSGLRGGFRPGATTSSALQGTAAVPGVAFGAGDAAGQIAYCTSRKSRMLRVCAELDLCQHV
ncbi:hypothetical protein DUNSADRAFT_14367 [Dunaliella salina]|uniref:Encoded protein n=1 Tax=Dunaliella salina TaxID=3046 RepID=A0ABQ7G7F9_DUNSA|nr:hypothetical protein DUNSADRAFT_14367 [Dunaliella salina]|eukprot:KAF5830538.1 hypothetical protein DUNSADRAFT_14367 [Dunaliella salina]